MGSNFGRKLEKIDSISDSVSPVNRINFEGNVQYKSQLGGLCTIMIYIAFLLILVKRAIPVLNKEDPEVQQRKVLSSMQYPVPLKKYPLITIAINSFGYLSKTNNI